MFMSSVTPEVNSELSELANITQHSVNTFVMEATEVSLNLTERVFCLNQVLVPELSPSFVAPVSTPINQNKHIFLKKE